MIILEPFRVVSEHISGTPLYFWGAFAAPLLRPQSSPGPALSTLPYKIDVHWPLASYGGGRCLCQPLQLRYAALCTLPSALAAEIHTEGWGDHLGVLKLIVTAYGRWETFIQFVWTGGTFEWGALSCFGQMEFKAYMRRGYICWSGHLKILK